MQLYHHLCNRWIIVREKQAFFFIQCPDSVHITCVQSKIKDIDIFFHTLLVGGFWDYHDIALQKETQSDLCCTFIVLFPDFIQHGIGKEILSSLGKRSTRFVLYAVFFHIFVGGCLLLENMRFYLIDCRFDLYETTQINQSVWIKIRNADCTNPALFIGFLSRSFFADSSYMLSFSVLCSCVCSRLISPSVSSWHKQDNTLMHQSPGHIQRRTPYNF